MLRDKTKENNTVLVLKEYIKDKEKVSRMFGSEDLLFESRSSEYHLRACIKIAFHFKDIMRRSEVTNLDEAQTLVQRLVQRRQFVYGAVETTVLTAKNVIQEKWCKGRLYHHALKITKHNVM